MLPYPTHVPALHHEGSASPTLESPRDASQALPDFGGPGSASTLGIAMGDGGMGPNAHGWVMPDLFGDAELGDQEFVSPFGSQILAPPNYRPMYPKSLHHTPSTTSLNSLSSLTDNYAGLYVACPPDTGRFPESISTTHSRTSSFSSIAGLDSISPQLATLWTAGFGQDFGFGTGQGAEIGPPKLYGQAPSLGRIGRVRSASRVAPYDRRERSESISGVSEAEDDLSSLVSSTASLAGYTNPLTAIGQPLHGSMSKISLQHRRSTSNVSAFSGPVLSDAMLSRKHRSSSLLVHQRKKSSVDVFRLKGTAADREVAVRHILTSAAEEARSLPSASQQDKAKSAWVKKWLQLSYTTSSGHTVPRQGLYASYSASSEEYGVRAINSASFGKAVRNAFPGIKTRRLGVRGNSKYHYISLRPAISVEAERLNRFGDSSGQWHVAASDGSMTFQADTTDDDDAEMEELEDSEEEEDDDHVFAFERKPSLSLIGPQPPVLAGSKRPNYLRRHTTSDASAPFTSVPMVPTPVYDLPLFPILGPSTELGLSIRRDAAQDFWNAFCRHQELLVNSIRTQQFDRFDTNMNEFWGLIPPAWMQISHQHIISQMITDAMAVTYNRIVVVLLQHYPRPMSTASQQSLRGLASRLETCIASCLSVHARDFSEPKMELTVRAAHLIVRCVDLHQLSTALLPILCSPAQVSDMLNAWDRLNVQSLVDQCALSCDCQQATVERVLQGFREWLACANTSGARSIENLGHWVDTMVEELQAAFPGGALSSGLVTRAGFVTSQVMRDFTLKSEPSFGLFQLIKTWIDDWISITVLRQTVFAAPRTSSASNSPVSVGMSRSSGLSGMTRMSISVPTQNPLELSESDLPTAVPPFTAGPASAPPAPGHAHAQLSMRAFGHGHGHGHGHSDASSIHAQALSLAHANLANMSMSGSRSAGVAGSAPGDYLV